LFTNAFLIPYLVLLATAGFPVFYLALEIGQRLRKVPLVCGIKCHLTSAILASAVLLCPSGKDLQSFVGEN